MVLFSVEPFADGIFKLFTSADAVANEFVEELKCVTAEQEGREFQVLLVRQRVHDGIGLLLQEN